jgi:hypothetical protein
MPDGLGRLITYTLINEETDDFSIFVFDNDLGTPVFIEHHKGTDLNLAFGFDPESTDLNDNIEYLALVQLFNFLSNYISNYSNIHPSILLPDLLTTFCSLNTVYMDDDVILTTNASLNTFKIFYSYGPNFWFSSNCEEFLCSVQSLSSNFYELNGNTENKTILAKVALLKKEATTPGFYEKYPNFDITNTITNK